ncbi:MAG TPA: alpha/beta hydrolase [Gammaproteobacteria bacterium]|nr:alpha/beta hydrolase [Gammaproteobacteria bacterium]
MSNFETVNNIQIHYEESGEGDPVIFLHGFGETLFTWSKLVAELSKTNHVIAIDLMGFGESDKPADSSLYTIEYQAKLVVQFIKQKKLKNIALIGHSYGGGVTMLATVMLLKNEGVIRKLIMIGGIAYKMPIPTFIKLLLIPVLSKLALALIPKRRMVMRMLNVAYYRTSKIEEGFISAYARPLNDARARSALVFTARLIIPDNLDDFTSQYEDIMVPALLIWGDKDVVVPVTMGKRLSQDLPDARLEVFEDCGHVPQEEEPEKTLLLISKFLQDD